MKKLFLSRPSRERTMLLVLLGLAAIAWLGSVAGRIGDRVHDGRALLSQVGEQKLWLANKAKITAQAAQAVSRLDSKRTLDGTHLVGELNKLAAAAGLSATIDSQHTEATDAFAFHSVQVTFRRVELKPLIAFYQTLAQRSPYIGLEQFALTTNRSNPEQTDVSFRIFSVEVVQGNPSPPPQS